MPYVERVTKAGNTIEIERYFTSRYKKKGISRGDKVKPTKEEQEKVNTRQAERKLRILINANYGYGDYHLVLDYIRRKGEPDRTPEQMRQDIDVFLRECRKEYRKAGLEFKYIHVMEIGKKGARHHHLVVNKIDTEILQRCWYKAYEGHNRVKVFPLDDSGNYAELASYLIKYTGTHKKGTDGALQGKRWNCSKNLVRPEPEYHIISDREYFKKEPKAIKGYYVDKNSVSMGVHSPEYYGYGYLRYTLVNLSKAYSRYDAENVAPVTRLLAGDWESADELIQHTEYEGIDIVTANMSLFGATWNLTKEDSENQIERYKALVYAKVQYYGDCTIYGKYDYCIIDNPPDIGLNVVNALAITDEVIVPVKVDEDALEGLDIVTEQIEDAKAFNPALKLAGVLITSYQNTDGEAAGVEWLEQKTDFNILGIIRYSKKVAENTFMRKPIYEYSPCCGAAQGYKKFVTAYTGKER